MKYSILGAIVLVSILLLDSCKKDDNTDDDSSNTTSTITSYYKTSFTFDGTARAWEDGKSGTYLNFHSALVKYMRSDSAVVEIDTFHNTKTIYFTRSTFKRWSQNVITNQTAGESLSISPDSAVAEDTTNAWAPLNTLPDVGYFRSFNRAVNGLSLGYKSGTTDGAVIRFKDAAGKIWKSDTLTQTGSTFTMQLLENGQAGSASQPGYVKLRYDYSCTLYNGSESKPISGSSTVFLLNITE